VEILRPFRVYLKGVIMSKLEKIFTETEEELLASAIQITIEYWKEEKAHWLVIEAYEKLYQKMGFLKCDL